MFSLFCVSSKLITAHSTYRAIQLCFYFIISLFNLLRSKAGPNVNWIRAASKLEVEIIRKEFKLALSMFFFCIYQRGVWIESLVRSGRFFCHSDLLPYFIISLAHFIRLFRLRANTQRETKCLIDMQLLALCRRTHTEACVHIPNVHYERAECWNE